MELTRRSFLKLGAAAAAPLALPVPARAAQPAILAEGLGAPRKEVVVATKCNRYGSAAAIEARHCRVCGGCAGQCPHGADVPAIVRALMYLEGYAQPVLAQETLAAAAFPCVSCPSCTVICRLGVRVPERVAAAVRLAGETRA